MKQNTPLDEANQITVQRLIRRYLSPDSDPIVTIEGACVMMKRVGNRYGVPPDGVTCRYQFLHPELGFAFNARAVWRCGDLMSPIGVHTVIEDYDDQAGHGRALCAVVNDWLQSLPL
jgi:hypothetical protein